MTTKATKTTIGLGAIMSPDGTAGRADDVSGRPVSASRALHSSLLLSAPLVTCAILSTIRDSVTQ